MLRTNTGNGKRGGKGVVFADDKRQEATQELASSKSPLPQAQALQSPSPQSPAQAPKLLAQPESPSLASRRPQGRPRALATPESLARSKANSSRQLLHRLRSQRQLGLDEEKPRSASTSDLLSFSASALKLSATDGAGKVKIIDVRAEPNRPRDVDFHEHQFANGDKYAGHWMCGMLTGAGEYTKKGGKESYSGTWVADTLEGYGEHRETNGRVYAGNFKVGVRHGRGRLRLPINNFAAAVPNKGKNDDDEEAEIASKNKGARLGPRPPAGTGTVGGAGEGFECEWRKGLMVGKVNKMWYKIYDDKTGLPIEGDEGRTTEGYINTLNQPTGPITRPEADRRYDVSAGGRRYEFAVDRGGYHPLLDPPFRPHTPRTRAMLSKNVAVYKDAAMQGWGDAAVARDDGDEVYEGEEKVCLDGIKRRYGKGTARWGPGAKEVYSGDWLYNQKHGKGERIWANGEVYNGTWTHGKMHGKGSYRWQGGAKYNGEFFKGRRNGQGVQIWPVPGRSGVMEYDGQWRNDKREGWGRLRYPDGREYSGEWVAGRMMGTGRLLYANGWTYEGEFYADMKHGEGARTEWYGPRSGRRFAVRYQYNVLQLKRDLGAVQRGPAAGGGDEAWGSGGEGRAALISGGSLLSLESSFGFRSAASPARAAAGTERAGSSDTGSPPPRRMPGGESPQPRRVGRGAVDSALGSAGGAGAGARVGLEGAADAGGESPREEAQGPHGQGRPPQVARLHLRGAIEQGSLALSPPRSPPFSPTDNNQDNLKAVEEDALRYPAGNWTYGELKERETNDEDNLDAY